MQDWLKWFHGPHQPFPVSEIAVKVAISVAVGLLVGFEREWSNKDIGARTFAMAALLGLLCSLLGPAAIVVGGIAVLILIAFANLRSITVARKIEATTSLALVLIFFLGILAGEGHIFTPVACSILIAMLLALKPQFRAFAGGLTQQEVRSAILLALLGFVVWPLLPNRYIDPWNLVEPRDAWIIVVVIACLGFMNYVLLRVYGWRVSDGDSGRPGELDSVCRGIGIHALSYGSGFSGGPGSATDVGGHVPAQHRDSGNLRPRSGEHSCSAAVGHDGRCGHLDISRLPQGGQRRSSPRPGATLADFAPESVASGNTISRRPGSRRSRRASLWKRRV